MIAVEFGEVEFLSRIAGKFRVRQAGGGVFFLDQPSQGEVFSLGKSCAGHDELSEKIHVGLLFLDIPNEAGFGEFGFRRFEEGF